MIQSYFLHVRAFVAILSLLALNLSLPFQCSGQHTVSIDVDINEAVGEMNPVWAYFGYDEPNYTYMKDGRKLISELADLSRGPVYYRAHNMLNTDEGPRAALKWGSTNAYTEDDQGNPVYDWTIIDKIVDTYIENGGKPMMEIANMPKALSSKPDSVPYRHNWHPDRNSQTPYSNTVHTGVHYPPNDYEKWAEVIYQWVRHSVERYGEEEVASWWWDVWNEPDGGWWMGTKEEYLKLYDYTADAVKRALPAAQVGGPAMHTSGRSAKAGQYFDDFLEHCRSGTNYVTGDKGSPLDFISFHAKGSPDVVGDGSHVRMDMGHHLNEMEPGFELIASFPEFRDLPVILGETDPEGCAACSVEFHPANDYRNGTMYASYIASSFGKTFELADEYDINLKGALSWAFQFEAKPWFAGFRSLATNGVNKPVLNVFRMFGMMDGQRVAVSQADPITASEVMDQGVRGEQPDVNALASTKGNSAWVMVWNYHDDDLPAMDTQVIINVDGILSDRAQIHHYRIDENHSNSYTAWQEMGAPQQVSRKQYTELEQFGSLELLTSPQWKDVSNRKVVIPFALPRQAVSFIQITW